MNSDNRCIVFSVVSGIALILAGYIIDMLLAVLGVMIVVCGLIVRFIPDAQLRIERHDKRVKESGVISSLSLLRRVS